MIVETSSNRDSDYCCDIQHILSLPSKYSDGEGDVWCVDEMSGATYVKHNSTSWFNAGYETPTHEFKPEELEVVEYEVIVNVREIKQQEYPDFLTYINVVYKDSENELKCMLGQYEMDKNIKIGLYNYKKYLEKIVE